MDNYIIIHGSFGSKDGNWFPWLKNELEKDNKDVVVPQMHRQEPSEIHSLPVQPEPPAERLRDVPSWHGWLFPVRPVFPRTGRRYRFLGRLPRSQG